MFMYFTLIGSMIMAVPFKIVLGLYLLVFLLLMCDTNIDGELDIYTPLCVIKTDLGFTFKVKSSKGLPLTFPEIFNSERQAGKHMYLFCAHKQPIGRLL